MKTEALALEQAPPLSIPLSFFCTAPAAIVAAGVVLLLEPSALTGPVIQPSTVALTHLGTLGFLGLVMMGALYQMVPVLAAAPVPVVRCAHLVHALACGGIVALGYAAVHSRIAIATGLMAMGMALGIFVLPVTWALWVRVRGATDTTVQGMRVAIAGLACVLILGWLMTRGYRGIAFPGPRSFWTSAHHGIALLGWVGALIVSVSWHVLPMFYLVPPTPLAVRRLAVPLLALAIVGPILALSTFAFAPAWIGLNGGQAAVTGTLLPAAIAVWLVHPVLTWRGLSSRGRRRPDASIALWRIGLVAAIVTFFVATTALLHPALPRMGLLFGWLAIWGWAGSIAMGMLSRIVPFLVWFHRLSPWVGKADVPSMRKLWPNRPTRWLAYAQSGSLVCGAAAILSGNATLARVTGGLVVVVAALLATAILRVALYRGPQPGQLGVPRFVGDDAALQPAHAGPARIAGGQVGGQGSERSIHRSTLEWLPKRFVERTEGLLKVPAVAYCGPDGRVDRRPEGTSSPGSARNQTRARNHGRSHSQGSRAGGP
ncbi:MAG: hypothetical protein V3V08_11965 [Nannocystaceae bacterium]